MWKQWHRSAWTRGALAVILALGAWLTLSPAGISNWMENFVLDAPIRFERGFGVQRHFSVDAAGHFAFLLLSGVTRPGVESINDFEHQGLSAAYRITVGDTTVASGRYPPYDVMTRWKGYDYHSFGGFWAVPHRDYKLSFTFEEADAAAAASDGHLRIAYDPVHAPEAKSKALLSNAFELGALIYSVLLANSLWTAFWDPRESDG